MAACIHPRGGALQVALELTATHRAAFNAGPFCCANAGAALFINFAKGA